LLTRSIDLEPFGLSAEEMISLYSKRIFTTLAVMAVAIAALDLASAGAIKSAVAYVHDGGELNLAELPDRIRAGISQISVLPNRTAVALAIPGDAAIPKFAPEPAAKIVAVPEQRDDSSPVAELAAARDLDAVQFAMMPPLTVAVTPTSAPPVAAPSAPKPADELAPENTSVVAAAPDSMKLASIDPASLTGPRPTEVSLPLIDPMPTVMPIPLAMVPMPMPAPGVPPPSPAQRLKLDDKAYAKAEHCLANTIYWEARSEPVKGQEAVAQVVMNRVFSGFYPHDVCSVVYQNASHHLACQFTFACDGKRKVINERGAWARANRIAKETLDGRIYVPAVAKSTHYHAIYVHPNWVHEMRKMVRYGIHNFYRPYAWGNGADEPVWGTAALMQEKNKKK
jgi:hypothetical protein